MFQNLFIIYLISINFIALILCYIDKLRARKGKYRISERSLILISLLLGCFGMIIGMNLFHHKTKKTKFKLIYLLSFLYFCVLLIVLTR